MKKGRVAKLTCITLILVISISLLPYNVLYDGSASASNTYSVPDFVLANAKHLINGRPARLTINDMTFTGKLHNVELNQSELRKVTEQVMREQGMSDQRLNELQNLVAKMNDTIGLSSADKKRVMDNILTTINAALGGLGTAAGYIGDGLGMLQSMYQLLEGEAQEALNGTMEAFGTKYVDMGTGLPVGQGVGYVKGGLMLAEEWQRGQRRYWDIREGLNATRELRKFFDVLESGINKYVEQNKKWNYLKFEALTDSSGIPGDQEKPFMLYGVQCVEKWTIWMSLNYVAPYSSELNLMGGHYDGEYEGSYVIHIAYDLSNLMHMLPQLIRTPEWKINHSNILESVLALLVDDDYPGNQVWTLPDSGQWIIRRQIQGTAVARIKHANEEIYPVQRSDDKSYSASPVLVNMKGRVDGADGFFYGEGAEFCITVSEKGFTFGFPDMPDIYTIPWRDDVWVRGDNAKWNWKLETLLRR